MGGLFEMAEGVMSVSPVGSMGQTSGSERASLYCRDAGSRSFLKMASLPSLGRGTGGELWLAAMAWGCLGEGASWMAGR